ncbi:MAG: DUF2807 domain-containing protein [Bacteroidia bacterium]|nr:DUF2807 domain-containing protein [Bacteroidia bacterium]
MILSLMLLCFYSCKDETCNCLKSTGSIGNTKVILDDFTKLTVDKNITTTIVTDTVCYAKVTAGKNLLDGIVFTQTQKSLSITNNNKCNWLRSYKNAFQVELHVKNLQEIQYASSGNLTLAAGFATDSLFIFSGTGAGSIIANVNVRVLNIVLNTGVADVTVAGNSTVNYFYSNGQGFIDTRNMKNHYTYIRSSGTNDCYVKTQNHLDAEIEAIGNIYYYGNPQTVNLKRNGTGNLIKGN